MSKEIEVDDDVFAAIQDLAEPLVDDANSVLRRVLQVHADNFGTPAMGEPENRRAPTGSLLPEGTYREPILLELLDGGGTGTAKEVTDAVGRRIGDAFTERDLERLKSGDIRWRTRVQFTRLRMKEEGLIEAKSPRGRWVLTDKGRKVAEDVGRAKQGDRSGGLLHLPALGSACHRCAHWPRAQRRLDRWRGLRRLVGAEAHLGRHLDARAGCVVVGHRLLARGCHRQGRGAAEAASGEKKSQTRSESKQAE